MALSVRKMVKKGVPALSYEKILESILPGWDISLVFVGSARAISINTQLRKKTYAPNVLSYETGKKSGEIIICPDVAKKQHESYDMTYPQFVVYLFIHGCMHLKGYAHGTTMERRERVLLSQVTHLYQAKNRNRN